MEIITWKQLGIYHNEVVILNIDGYYDPIIEMLKKAISQNFMDQKHEQLWRVTDSVEEALNMIRQ